MNKRRATKITTLLKDFERTREKYITRIGMIADDEQDYFDGLSFDAQESDRGIAAERAIEQLEAAMDEIENTFGAIATYLEEASRTMPNPT